MPKLWDISLCENGETIISNLPVADLVRSAQLESKMRKTLGFLQPKLWEVQIFYRRQNVKSLRGAERFSAAKVLAQRATSFPKIKSSCATEVEIQIKGKSTRLVNTRIYKKLNVVENDFENSRFKIFDAGK